MAGYIGGRVAISSPQQIETKHTLTATASQTSIPNIGYTVGAVHVYQNGIGIPLLMIGMRLPKNIHYK